MYGNSYESAQDRTTTNSFIAAVYGWMCFGLALTAITAVTIGLKPELAKTVVGNPKIFIGLIIFELVLVLGLCWGMRFMNSAVATTLFLLYAAVNGATLSVIFLMYELGSIGVTFFVTAGTFGAMSIYGYTTKRDLTSLGNLLGMALFGLIIASIANMFFANSTLYWITTYAGVLIFVGLTAYDTQKIKKISHGMTAGSEMAAKASIMGALALYLDFINLFLFLLRLFGRRR
jgi:uncharacterized protein